MLRSLCSFIAAPDPYNNPLAPEIAQLYLADRSKHDQIAHEWVQKCAERRAAGEDEVATKARRRGTVAGSSFLKRFLFACARRACEG